MRAAHNLQLSFDRLFEWGRIVDRRQQLIVRMRPGFCRYAEFGRQLLALGVHGCEFAAAQEDHLLLQPAAPYNPFSDMLRIDLP
jgi:hypothetical protein